MALTQGVTGDGGTTTGAYETAYKQTTNGGSFTTFCVRCTSGTAQVRVSDTQGNSLFGASGYAAVPAGEKEYFRCHNGSIGQVDIGGTCTASWYPVVTTRD